MTRNFSIEQAKNIVKEHKNRDLMSFYSSREPTDLELCVEYLMKLMFDKDEKFVSNCFSVFFRGDIYKQGDKYIISKDNEEIEFKKIDESILKAINSERGKCHRNCLEACDKFDDIDDAYVCTSEVTARYDEPGLLHSYLEVGNSVVDLTYRFMMDKDCYERCFNVNVLSRNKVGDIKRDLNTGKFEKFVNEYSSTGVGLEDYFLARKDYMSKIEEKTKN